MQFVFRIHGVWKLKPPAYRLLGIMSEPIVIIGDGAMGTICAIMLSQNNLRVRLWSAFPENAREIDRLRENRRYLPGFALPASIEVTADDEIGRASCRERV